MRNNRLAIASALLVLLLATAVWKLKGTKEDVTTDPGLEQALPQIAKEDIESLEILRAEAPTIRLERRDDQWRVVVPVEAETDDTAVQAALNELAGLEAVGIAATVSKNHERLEVTEATATRVIARKGESVLLDVLLGAYRSGNTMVRRLDAEGETVFAAKGSIRHPFNKALKDWRDRRIVELEPEHVVSLTLDSDKGRFRFEKDADGWKQAAGEKAIPRFDAGKVSSLVSVLARLKAANFATGETTEESAGLATPAATVTLVARTLPDAEQQAPTDDAEQAPADKATTEPEASEQTIVLRLGNAPADDTANRYLKRAGSDVLYLISNYTADRMAPEAAAFQAEEPAEAAKAPAPGGPERVNVHPLEAFNPNG